MSNIEVSDKIHNLLIADTTEEYTSALTELGAVVSSPNENLVVFQTAELRLTTQALEVINDTTWNERGAFLSTNTYGIGDVVTYNGQTWYCSQPNGVNYPATKLIDCPGENNSIRFTARNTGAYGNTISIEYAVPGNQFTYETEVVPEAADEIVVIPAGSAQLKVNGITDANTESGGVFSNPTLDFAGIHMMRPYWKSEGWTFRADAESNPTAGSHGSSSNFTGAAAVYYNGNEWIVESKNEFYASTETVGNFPVGIGSYWTGHSGLNTFYLTNHVSSAAQVIEKVNSYLVGGTTLTVTAQAEGDVTGSIQANPSTLLSGSGTVPTEGIFWTLIDGTTNATSEGLPNTIAKRNNEGEISFGRSITINAPANSSADLILGNVQTGDSALEANGRIIFRGSTYGEADTMLVGSSVGLGITSSITGATYIGVPPMQTRAALDFSELSEDHNYIFPDESGTVSLSNSGEYVTGEKEYAIRPTLISTNVTTPPIAGSLVSRNDLDTRMALSFLRGQYNWGSKHSDYVTSGTVGTDNAVISMATGAAANGLALIRGSNSSATLRTWHTPTSSKGMVNWSQRTIYTLRIYPGDISGANTVARFYLGQIYTTVTAVDPAGADKVIGFKITNGLVSVVVANGTTTESTVLNLAALASNDYDLTLDCDGFGNWDAYANGEFLQSGTSAPQGYGVAGNNGLCVTLTNGATATNRNLWIVDQKTLQISPVLGKGSSGNNSYVYTSNGSNLTIVEYTGSGGAITIPDSIDGISVNSIGASAFEGKAITSVIIPNSVISIGQAAFRDCTGLTSLTIGTGVTDIENSAFAGCTNLTSVTIPDSVTSIGQFAFMECSALASLYLGDGLTSIGSSAFSRCISLVGVNIVPSITSISYATFEFCLSLNSVTGCDGLTNISQNAFQGCRAFTTFTIPSTVTTIGQNAFGGCTGLVTLSIPNSVSIINGNVFIGCTSLTNVSIGSGLASIGGNAFTNCTSLTTVFFAGNAPTIPVRYTYTGEAIPLSQENWTNTTATVYRNAGSTGWGSTFAGRPVLID